MLRSIFGPSQSEIWGQIAADIGGDLIDGGFWKGKILRYEHEDWTVVLDVFARTTGKTTVPFTRMRAPFLNKDDFQFKITREGFFEGIRKFFGAQDIQIGDPFFDDNFLIQSNNETKIKNLLNHQELKALIHKQPHIYLKICDGEGLFHNKFPDGVNELYFESRGVIKQKEQLEALFAAFSIILSRLVQFDSAYEDDPGFEY